MHVSTSSGEEWQEVSAPPLYEKSCTRREASELTSDCVEASSSDPSRSGGDNNETRKERRGGVNEVEEVRGEEDESERDGQKK